MKKSGNERAAEIHTRAGVLAVDTSFERASVSLSGEGAERTATWVAAGGHSRELLGRVKALLDDAGIGLADLSLLVAVTGPGSFTGLRVGLAAIQGLALATPLPCLGVSALEAMASLAPGGPGAVIATRQGYRDDVFAQAFDKHGRPLGHAFVVGVANLRSLAAYSPAVVLGDGVARYEALFAEALPGVRLLGDPGPLAAAAGRLARGRANESGAPSLLRPLYIRPVDIGAPRRA